MVSILNKYRGFFIPYLIFLLLAGAFILIYTREETHIILNQFLTPWLNVFFKYYTHLGDGMMLFTISIILLFIRFRYAFFLGITGIVSGLFTNFLKNYFFDDVDRPYFYFRYYYQGDFNPELVLPESAMNIHHSFPSGHTTGAFCLFVGIMFIVNKSNRAWVFFVLAFLGGYSRVYLSQHFLVDIYVGSLIGTVTSVVGWYLFEKIDSKGNIKWWNKSLLRLK